MKRNVRACRTGGQRGSYRASLRHIEPTLRVPVPAGCRDKALPSCRKPWRKVGDRHCHYVLSYPLRKCQGRRSEHRRRTVRCAVPRIYVPTYERTNSDRSLGTPSRAGVTLRARSPLGRRPEELHKRLSCGISSIDTDFIARICYTSSTQTQIGGESVQTILSSLSKHYFITRGRIKAKCKSARLVSHTGTRTYRPTKDSNKRRSQPCNNQQRITPPASLVQGWRCTYLITLPSPLCMCPMTLHFYTHSTTHGREITIDFGIKTATSDVY